MAEYPKTEKQNLLKHWMPGCAKQKSHKWNCRFFLNSRGKSRRKLSIFYSSDDETSVNYWPTCYQKKKKTLTVHSNILQFSC